MEMFTTLMEESRGSIENRKLHTYGSYEEFGSRMYQGLALPGKISMSIQASSMHHCLPERTIPLNQYTHMEVAFRTQNNSNAFIDDITDNETVIEGFKDCWDGMSYGYVPIILIQLLFMDLAVV